MKDRLTIQHDPKGGFYVVIDTATEHYTRASEAAQVVSNELGLHSELTALIADQEQNIKELTTECAHMKKALDSAAQEFEQLRAELEKEKATKNKYILEACDWKDTVAKLAQLMARKFG